VKGRIHWFDDLSGDGMVSLEDGRSVYLHYSAIKNGDITKRKCNGRMKNWVSVKSGYIGDVELVQDSTFRQVSKFTVTERAEPPAQESAYIDRQIMKAKLYIIDKEFDEIIPIDHYSDRIRAIKSKVKPTKKDQEKLELLNHRYFQYVQDIKTWNVDRTAARLAVYREHSRFFSQSDRT
jgi:cold shock CspA family protein